MAPAKTFVTVPVFPVVRVTRVAPAEGYVFGRKRGDTIEIIEQKSGTSTTTLQCECSGSGACKLQVIEGYALCSADTCKSCAFRIKVPGAAFVNYLAEIFAESQSQKLISLPVFPGIAVQHVELASGHKFGRPRAGKVGVLARQKSTGTGTTLECRCATGEGGTCNIEVVGGLAMCSSGTCTRCTWKVTVPGAAFAGYLALIV
jgi:hypothetical protein